MRKRRSVGGADYAEWGGQLGGRWDTCHVRRLVGGRVGYRPALIGRPVGGAQVMTNIAKIAATSVAQVRGGGGGRL